MISTIDSSSLNRVSSHSINFVPEITIYKVLNSRRWCVVHHQIPLFLPSLVAVFVENPGISHSLVSSHGIVSFEPQCTKSLFKTEMICRKAPTRRDGVNAIFTQKYADGAKVCPDWTFIFKRDRVWMGIEPVHPSVWDARKFDDFGPTRRSLAHAPPPCKHHSDGQTLFRRNLTDYDAILPCRRVHQNLNAQAVWTSKTLQGDANYWLKSNLFAKIYEV